MVRSSEHSQTLERGAAAFLTSGLGSGLGLGLGLGIGVGLLYARALIPPSEVLPSPRTSATPGRSIRSRCQEDSFLKIIRTVHISGQREYLVRTRVCPVPIPDLENVQHTCYGIPTSYRYHFILLCSSVLFLRMGIFFSSCRGSFLVLSAPEHAGSPPVHHDASVGRVRGPWYALWGFEVAKTGK